eukprot:1660375-Rhodomonas_salina.2
MPFLSLIFLLFLLLSRKPPHRAPCRTSPARILDSGARRRHLSALVGDANSGFGWAGADQGPARGGQDNEPEGPEARLPRRLGLPLSRRLSALYLTLPRIRAPSDSCRRASDATSFLLAMSFVGDRTWALRAAACWFSVATARLERPKPDLRCYPEPMPSDRAATFRVQDLCRARSCRVRRSRARQRRRFAPSPSVSASEHCCECAHRSGQTPLE